MKNIFKNILIYALVLIFVLGLAVSPVVAQTPPYSDDYEEVDVKVNGKAISDKAFTIKGNVYIKVSTLKKYGDMSHLTVNTADSKITFKASDLDLNLGSDEATNFVTKYAGECFIPTKSFDDENGKKDVFVSIGPIAQIAKLAWSYSNGTLLISQYSKATNLATAGVVTNTVASLKNKSVASLSTGEKVFIIKESNSFYKVESLDGSQYYVNKSEIKKVDDVSQLNDFEYIVTSKDTFGGKINLGWLNMADNATRTPLPPEDNTGLNVLSPIWLHSPANRDGYVRHLCDYGYVQLAHEKGYKVWMCANNNFLETGTTKYTTQVLASDKLSNRVIGQYLLYACLYEVDGICLDYETLTNSDKDNFTKFNQKLGKYCDQLGITYSIATYPYNKSNCYRYDFEKLGECADYIAPMMYWTSKTNVGSTSDYGWYTDSVNQLASVVPANKILLGTPFFARFWYTDQNGNVINSSSNTGTIGMGSVLEKISNKNFNKTWDDSAKQYILTYPSDTGNYVKLWMEDVTSMAYRLDYVLDAGLAGTACWALDQESPDLLQIIDDVYNHGANPKSYFK